VIRLRHKTTLPKFLTQDTQNEPAPEVLTGLEPRLRPHTLHLEATSARNRLPVRSLGQAGPLRPMQTDRRDLSRALPPAYWRGDVRNVHVTGTLAGMPAARTGAERYLARRLEDPEYRQAYEEARERIEQIDLVIRAFDARREELHLTKAELARRAGVKPEAIRRLFSAEKPNPTLTTLVALAGALDLEIRPTPRGPSATRARSAASGTRRRSA